VGTLTSIAILSGGVLIEKAGMLIRSRQAAIAANLMMFLIIIIRTPILMLLSYYSSNTLSL
jgi:uncharacterized membrane protein YidH (DUF202 family)